VLVLRHISYWAAALAAFFLSGLELARVFHQPHVPGLLALFGGMAVAYAIVWVLLRGAPHG
jgi:hypothetical protein